MRNPAGVVVEEGEKRERETSLCRIQPSPTEQAVLARRNQGMLQGLGLGRAASVSSVSLAQIPRHWIQRLEARPVCPLLTLCRAQLNVKQTAPNVLVKGYFHYCLETAKVLFSFR